VSLTITASWSRITALSFSQSRLPPGTYPISRVHNALPPKPHQGPTYDVLIWQLPLRNNNNSNDTRPLSLDILLYVQPPPFNEHNHIYSDLQTPQYGQLAESTKNLLKDHKVGLLPSSLSTSLAPHFSKFSDDSLALHSAQSGYPHLKSLKVYIISAQYGLGIFGI